MRFTAQSSLVLGLAATGTAHPYASVQNRAVSADEKAQAVIDAFQLSWNGYYEHAFPHDTLRPVSNSYEDDRYFGCKVSGAQVALAKSRH